MDVLRQHFFVWCLASWAFYVILLHSWSALFLTELLLVLWICILGLSIYDFKNCSFTSLDNRVLEWLNFFYSSDLTLSLYFFFIKKIHKKIKKKFLEMMWAEMRKMKETIHKPCPHGIAAMYHRVYKIVDWWRYFRSQLLLSSNTCGEWTLPLSPNLKRIKMEENIKKFWFNCFISVFFFLFIIVIEYSALNSASRGHWRFAACN
jgi:hypothetical protein